MKVELIGNNKVRAQVEAALALRARALSLEEEAKSIKKEANDALLSLLPALPETSVEQPMVGSVSYIVTNRKKLDMEGFKLILLQKGVLASVIQQAEDGATSYSASASVRFSPWKE